MECMVAIRSAAAMTKLLRWEGCTLTLQEHRVSDRRTKVGIRRCTGELVPDRECRQEVKAEMPMSVQ